MDKVKVIALVSGGLDSALAAALTARLGFSVSGLFVRTGFSCGQDRGAFVQATADELGIPVRVLDASEAYLDVVRHPKHGYGSAMNPCLDCRIFYLKRAAEFMAEQGASFVVTGEVLGQRPMSQHRRALDLVARESGLGDRLVRPLSGRLLEPTYPEHQGWVHREDWLDLQGRSRKRQLELASRWGIRSFGQPSGGCCILLEKSYARRLKDAFRHHDRDALDRQAFTLLRYGRRFRLSDTSVLIVGRDEQENARIAELARGEWILVFPEVPGPTALVQGDPSEEMLTFAARLTARYADAVPGVPVTLHAERDGEKRTLQVVPLGSDDPVLEQLRIGE